MLNVSKIKELSNEFQIPYEDVLLIALNRYGVVSSIPDNRIRFKLKLKDTNEIFYLAICVNTYQSPFELNIKGTLMLSGEIVGDIVEIEKDTCDSTYFRRNKTELTLNSNMRSMCKGCKFCGTYNLDPDDRIDMRSEDKMANYLEKILAKNNMNDFSNLVRITICTGCFENEQALVNHIVMVRRLFEKYGFKKRIRYIGSQLRSEDALKKIQSEIQLFSLSLTLECFTKRDERMRAEKASLKLDDIYKLLSKSKELGFSTNYLYILGLDSMEDMKRGMIRLLDCINRFPVIQIMQNYLPSQEEQRVEGASDIEYYLQSRKMIESIFGTTKLHPRSWENYRSLFYFMYNNKPYECIRM